MDQDSAGSAVHDGEEERRLFLLAAIVESSDDAIVGMSREGAILTWNRGAMEMLGYSEREAVGQPVSLLFDDDAQDQLAGLLQAVTQGEHMRQRQFAWVTRSGFHVEVAVTVSPVRDRTGAIVAASVVGRDVSEQRWMAATLDDTIAKLGGALSEAQEAEARSRRFLADAAHQLRGPMAAIRANAESILEGLEEEDRDRLLRNLVREVARSDRLISALLTMARLDQGQGVVPAPCDIIFLCSDEADRTWSLAPHLDIVVRAEELPGGPLNLDARAVREILSNLLDNARRHAVGWIRLLVTVNHPYLDIRVIDDGPGIPRAMATRAFERFVSLDGKGGSGLGLPIAKELARAHGGDLTYLSREEGFLLRLPLTEDAIPPTPDGQD